MTIALNDVRVLLVEDEMLVCMDIELMLEDIGCKVVGPAANVSNALKLIDEEPIDMAVIDVNLGSERSYPIADRLTMLGIPFILSTGYAQVDAPYDACPRVQKPFCIKQLRDCLETVHDRTRGAQSAELQPKG